MNELSFWAYAALAIVPGLVWLYAFFRMDRFEPEPLGLLLKTFVVGGLALFPALYAEKILLTQGLGLPSSLVLANLSSLDLFKVCFLVVAPLEEILKFLAAWICVGNNPEYNEPMDGLIYLVAAGLGFSTAENLYYLSSLNVGSLAVRGIFSCFIHAMCSGLIGYGWSEVRFRNRSLFALWLAILTAILSHGLFDFIAFGARRSAFFVMALVLVLLNGVVMREVADALRRSPFRPDSEDDLED